MLNNPNVIIKNDLNNSIYKIQNKYNFKTLKDLYLHLHYNDSLFIKEMNKQIRKKTGLKNKQYMKQYYTINTSDFLLSNKYLTQYPFKYIIQSKMKSTN